jgi:hypothetical protein
MSWRQYDGPRCRTVFKFKMHAISDFENAARARRHSAKPINGPGIEYMHDFGSQLQF